MQNTETRPFLKSQATDATAALPQPVDRPVVVAQDAAGIYRLVGPDQPGNGTAGRISQLVIQRSNLGGANTSPMPDALVDLGRGTMFAPAGQLAGRNGGVIPKSISSERVFIKGLGESYDSLQPILAAGNLRFLSPDVQRLVSGIAEASLGKRAADQGRTGGVVHKTRVSHLHPVASSPNAAHPDRLLKEVSRRTPFTRQDVEDAAKHHFSGSALNEAVAAVLNSAKVMRINTGNDVASFYSTRNMLATERAMLASTDVMKRNAEHGVPTALVDTAVGDGQTQKGGSPGIRLSDEQVQAVRHVTGPEQITAIVGYAGAGKSTMLASARKAWEAAGYTVNGAALSGKAAQGLATSSGIPSRTLAAWEIGWKNGRLPIGKRDIFVIDEAGMIGSQKMAHFVESVQKKGAKLVLVGDAEQLQPIHAGAPFKAISEQLGSVTLTGVRRQFETWQQRQSENFGEARTATAISSYVDHGLVAFSDDRKATIQRAVRDYVADMARSRHELADGSKEQSTIALAYSQEDVRMLNQQLRTALRDAGETQAGPTGADHQWQVRIPEDNNRFRSEVRQFANGDKIMFLQNNSELGVLNGMIGTIETVTARHMKVRLPELGGQPGKTVDLVNEARNSRNNENYLQIDHGYAITIHKSQGGTWDRSYVVASGKMDSHLSYVAMSRHRTSVQIYASRDEFADTDALVRALSRPSNSSLPAPPRDLHEERMSELVTAMKRWRMSGSEISSTGAIANASDTSAAGETSTTHRQEEQHAGKRDPDEAVRKWRDEVNRQRSFGAGKSSEENEASRRRNELVQERRALSRDGPER